MISVAFTGDIAFSGYFKNSWDREDLLEEDIVAFLNKSDYVVGNIECPITREKIDSDRILNHVMVPEAEIVLRNLNINIWNLGNNHIMDCGINGLRDTLACVKNSGIVSIGAGINVKDASKPIIVGDDVKIGMVSFVKPIWTWLNAGMEKPGAICWGGDFQKVKMIIEGLKKKCDYLIAVIHGGDEFASMPMPYDRKAYIKILDYGADIIVAHHPHVVQNYETVGGKLIIYSLGNFIFDTDYQRQQKHTDVGILVKFNFSKINYEWKYLPIRINRSSSKIEVCDCPTIFTDIQQRDYALLWPLAARMFWRNEKQAQIFKNPQLAYLGILRRIKRELGKMRHKKGLILRIGIILSWFYIWRFSKRRDIVAYICSN